jgi:hypothetical protein
MEGFSVAITKLRIDLAQGVVEVEGDDSFVHEVYNDFKERLLINQTFPPKSHTAENKPKSHSAFKSLAKPDSENPPKKKRTSSRGSASGSIVKSLNLSGGGKVERLKDFYNKYNPSSNYERNLIFVYYLQQKLELEGITIDHVFTCYRDVGIKVPKALKQSLIDTSANKGWLDTSSTDNITVAISGINYIEHDMQQSSTDSK